MPTYEYRCKDCGDHLEVVQSFADDPLTTCPRCSGTLKKVFAPVGIAFKGSGFYRNDSRSSKQPASASSSGSSGSSAESSSGSGSSSGDGSSGSTSSTTKESTSSSSSSSTGASPAAKSA
jgi:putative FmdB family regulatory protein